MKNYSNKALTPDEIAKLEDDIQSNNELIKKLKEQDEIIRLLKEVVDHSYFIGQHVQAGDENCQYKGRVGIVYDDGDIEYIENSATHPNPVKIN